MRVSFGIKENKGAVYVKETNSEFFGGVTVNQKYEFDVQGWYDAEDLILICGDHIRYFDKINGTWMKTDRLSNEKMREFDELIMIEDLFVRVKRQIV